MHPWRTPNRGGELIADLDEEGFQGRGAWMLFSCSLLIPGSALPKRCEKTIGRGEKI
jgi:hypothetical protein